MSSIRNRRSVAVLLGAFLTAGVSGAGESAEGPDDAMLASLVDEALNHNPDIAAAQEEVAAWRARPEQARSLPDPVLWLMYTNDGWSPSLGSRNMTTLAANWTQELPFPGKRRLRGQIASLTADEREEQLQRTRLSVAAAVKRAYTGLLQARDLLDLIRDQGEIWREIEGVARARYAVGQGVQQDVLRVQVEVTRIDQLEAEQRAEAEVRRAELNRLLGRLADARIETPSPLVLRPEDRPPTEILEWVRGRSPELKAAHVAVDRERAAVALARKEFKPDFTVQGGYLNRGGLDPMWQAGVGVTLPLDRKKRESGLAEAEARLREVERVAEAVELQMRYRTQERLAQIAAAERIAGLYERGLIPQDRMAVEAGVANYQAGKVPFVTVLESLASLYGDRSAYVRLLAGHAKTRASLEEASLEATSDLPTTSAPTAAGKGMGSNGGAKDAGSMATGSVGSR